MWKGGRTGEAGNAKRHPLAGKPRKNWKNLPSSRTTGQTREGRMVTTAIVANKCFEEGGKRGEQKAWPWGGRKGGLGTGRRHEVVNSAECPER
jgi:hypothetical protein